MTPSPHHLRTFHANVVLVTVGAMLASPCQATRWPIDPNDAAQRIMTTYGEYQHYPNSNTNPEPYLHDGVDIVVPAGTAMYSVQDGIVRYARFREFCWRRADQLEPEWAGDYMTKAYQFVIVEDLNGGMPAEVGWAYGHVKADDFGEPLGKRNPVGISVDEGNWLTIVQRFTGEAFSHLHLSKYVKKEGSPNPWTE
ncbi:hypothetical protein JXA88_00010 [Candidatus Fermentibacteria bacterium]|nr:hypothetical protein [Candidatus Fermentibacteria bacterium]